MKYLQGETISITIGSEEVDLRALDFSLWLYKYPNRTIVIPKNEMEVVEGSYVCLIPSSVTAKMDVGTHYLELVGVDDQVIISKEEAFEIEKSVSKGGLNE